MAIFPNIELEKKVQTNEKTRINATKSFATQDEAAVSLVRIKPSASDSFIEVSATDATDSSYWYLDWQYASDGTQTIELEITTGESPSEVVTTFSKTIEVVLPEDERLFSTDQDLMSEEPDILRFVKDGKSSFNDVHRTVQAKILDDIYRARITASDGSKITLDEVIDTEELLQWSKYMALRIIFEMQSNSVDDVFMIKAKTYARMQEESRNMAYNKMKLDYNKDGALDNNESRNLRSGDLVRV